jgi:hypothetical protein
MNILGCEDSTPVGQTPPTPGSIGTVNNPIPSSFAIPGTEGDIKVFSFLYTDTDGVKKLRMLVVKVRTPTPGQPSTTGLYSLLEWNNKNQDWTTTLASDIQLVDANGNCIANNPWGVCQIGNTLYIITYDDQKIYILGGDELSGKTGNYKPDATPFDVRPAASLPTTAKGQAIIALDNGSNHFLFALYTLPTSTGYDPSVLVRLQAGSTVTYDKKTTVGKNAQMIFPVADATNVYNLFIPAIGGEQTATGNYSDSNIAKLPAFTAGWPLSAPQILISNAPNPTNPVPVYATFNFDAIAISADGGNDAPAYVLSGLYDGTYDYKRYALYRTTAGKLNTLAAGTLVATAVTNGDLTLVDTGADPGYMWDILYENKGAGEVGRLWFLRGGPIIVSTGDTYGARSITFGRGELPGQFGGDVINAVDLTSEAARQADAGVSHRHSLRGTLPTRPAAAVEEEEEK